MNLLVDVLTSNPAIVTAAISRFQREHKDPDLFWLAQTLQEAPGGLSAEISARLRDAPRLTRGDIHEAVEDAYLPVAEEHTWSRSVEAASQLPPVKSPEWATMIGNPGTGLGIIVPDDNLPTRKITLFTEDEDYRTVDISTTPPYTVTAHALDQHCKLPERALCPSPGSCGATCQPRKVLLKRKGPGLKCLCEHVR